ncbi:MAG: sugar phosphate isomerase/epimerase [Candidatus Sumerlaeia bacterium]|nr:sugar phosphate isomerase/epimerase [Candidatus Sumerlaeia bacterium]
MNLNFAVCAGGLDTAETTAARLASHGVRAVEVGPAFPAHGSKDDLARVREAFTNEGINIHSVHAPFRADIQLSAPEGEARRSVEAFYRDFLPRVASLGAKVVVVHGGPPAPSAEHPAMLMRATWMLRALAPLASDLGIRLALENLPPAWPGSNPVELAEIAAALDRDSVGLCLDTGHAHMSGDVCEALRVMKPHLVAFHIHDNDGTEDLHLPPPFGTIDWEAFVREWGDYSFDGPLTLECSAWGDEFLAKDRDEDFDLPKVIEGARELFSHLNARIRREGDLRRADPTARVRGACPHRNDLHM